VRPAVQATLFVRLSFPLSTLAALLASEMLVIMHMTARAMFVHAHTTSHTDYPFLTAEAG